MTATAMKSRPVASTRRTWNLEAKVKKWHDQESFERGDAPFEVVRSRHNLLVNAGIQRLLDQLIGATAAPYNAANSRVGVGNSNTAAVASQTDLQAAAGAGNRQFKLVSSGPTRSSQTVTWVITVASGEANFPWEEWCVDIGTADGTTVVTPMLNRKVASLGTKVAGAVWTFTVTLTIS